MWRSVFVVSAAVGCGDGSFPPCAHELRKRPPSTHFRLMLMATAFSALCLVRYGSRMIEFCFFI
jgi:hypothetical protein